MTLQRASYQFKAGYWLLGGLCFLLVASEYCQAVGKSPQHSKERYLAAAKRFADRMLSDGRDTYGTEHTPLFVEGLHGSTLRPAVWLGPEGQSWILSNLANQQSLLRLLDGLTSYTGDPQYRQAADVTVRYVFEHLRTPNGLLYWGGHFAWDLESESPVGQYPNTHELKSNQPHFELMWRVNPDHTRKLLETIWAAHIVDWTKLDYNRHGNASRDAWPHWDSAFEESIHVPFPAKGGNWSFCNVTPPLMHAGVTLATLGENDNALLWTRRLLFRWQQARNLKTGLSGGQLSYRQPDRAQLALGHVHPDIREEEIVASYHQTTRYHSLPLAEFQAAETLLAYGGKHAELGEELIQWASDDLKTYARECYDASTGSFTSMTTNGTPLGWRYTKEGYYTAEKLKPRPVTGNLVWAYAMAYRLTRDLEHWHMLREICKHSGLGKLGESPGETPSLNDDTASEDWRHIYALLDLYEATNDQRLLHLACRVADNILGLQTDKDIFVRPGREYGRTGDDAPLALLHLAATIDGKRGLLPKAIRDASFFHCVYESPGSQRPITFRSFDFNVFYGRDGRD